MGIGQKVGQKVGQKIQRYGISLGLAQFLWLTPAVMAHQVEIAGEVGGTIHIEPNDTPRAGTPNLAWFALVRQGGEPIPLADCNCQLALYNQPYNVSAAPIQTPSLRPVSEEGYENIPGAEITFPQVGAYVLVLTGEPKQPDDFQPFELKFDVTVATGASAPQITETPAIDTNAEQVSPSNQNTQPNYAAWAVGAGVIGVGAIAIARWLKRRK